ncbi:MAG: DUF523 domain-containing protein [Firmicutes bacterium]|nr:DUF523 domain-containing protein [Bacillota bacterium]
MILVSACLLGETCKYDGGSNLCPQVIGYLQGRDYIAVCPEALGGLPVPRPPAELQGGDGESFWAGKAAVVNRRGADVSAQFAAGAEAVLQICRAHAVELAILKESSPSCGSSRVYDGSFCHKAIAGSGVCAALLRQNGVPVVSEKTLPGAEDEPSQKHIEP